jgi:hypothetical protein
MAARTGDLPLMNLLLDVGANPFITNADNSTALLAAAGIGDLGSGQQSAGTEAEAIEVVKLLLELGADINAVDENGETAMHGAAYQNWPQLVEFLNENGADVDVWNRKNNWGWTPLLIAQGYREGNFRPDIATIAAVERVMRAAGVTPPAPGPDVVANQQSWDKKKPDWHKEKKSPPDPKEKTPADAQEKKPANGADEPEAKDPAPKNRCRPRVSTAQGVSTFSSATAPSIFGVSHVGHTFSQTLGRSRRLWRHAALAPLRSPQQASDSTPADAMKLDHCGRNFHRES